MEQPVQMVAMPDHALILSCQVQGVESLVLWARVLPDNPTVERWFYLVETGKEVPAGKIFTHISTVQFWNGDYVLHVCEGINPNDG